METFSNHTLALEQGASANQLISTSLMHPHFYHLLLQRIPFLGPVTYKKCLSQIGLPAEIFLVNESELKKCGMQAKAILKIQTLKAMCSARSIELLRDSVFNGVIKDLNWLSHKNHTLLAWDDLCYPTLLKEIYDPPTLLFVKGNAALLKRQQLAIVGSRRPSKSGMMTTHQFAQDLVAHGYTITSGLAMGIDTYAHEGALTAAEQTTGSTRGVSTIAVLAHGLDGIYPKRNQSLAAKVLNGGGALVSEFPVGVTPRPEYFPRRNRIISGLSLGVLVVEAAVKSGSLVTAYSALEQNREVFAVPGSIHSPVSKGCHQLIKTGAKLVECTQDIIEELSPNLDQTQDMASPQGLATNRLGQTIPLGPSPEVLKQKERELWDHIDHEEQSANHLASILGWPVSEISATLTLLELKKFIVHGESGYTRRQ